MCLCYNVFLFFILFCLNSGLFGFILFFPASLFSKEREKERAQSWGGGEVGSWGGGEDVGEAGGGEL